MKRYFGIKSALLVVLLAVAGATLMSQAKNIEPEGGIEFYHGSWDQAIRKAKSENKLIFVDAYTSWCGPCKWMAANTFTDAQVGEYFNRHFINVKMDMERGEGPAFARRFRVAAYPTLLFLDGNENVVLRSMGSKPAQEFLDLGKQAVAKH